MHGRSGRGMPLGTNAPHTLHSPFSFDRFISTFFSFAFRLVQSPQPHPPPYPTQCSAKADGIQFVCLFVCFLHIFFCGKTRKEGRRRERVETMFWFVFFALFYFTNGARKEGRIVFIFCFRFCLIFVANEASKGGKKEKQKFFFVIYVLLKFCGERS